MDAQVFPVTNPIYRPRYRPQLITDYQALLVLDMEIVQQSTVRSEADFALIVRDFNQLMNQYAMNPAFWLALGKKFCDLRMFEASLAALDLAQDIILEPGFEEELEALGLDIGFMMAYCYRSLEKLEEAIAFSWDLIQHMQEVGEEDPFSYVFAASCCPDKKTGKDREEILAVGLQRFPGSIDILLELARHHFSKRDLTSAKSFFHAAHEYDDSQTMALAGLTISYLLDGLDYESFLLYSTKTLASTPRSKADIYQLGQIHFLRQQYSEAQNCYARASLGPYYSQTWASDKIYAEFNI